MFYHKLFFFEECSWGFRQAKKKKKNLFAVPFEVFYLERLSEVELLYLGLV